MARLARMGGGARDPLSPSDARSRRGLPRDRADAGVSVATLGVIRAAIRAGHTDHGAADPTQGGVTTAMLAGLRREIGRPARQAAGLTAAALEVVAAATPDTPAGLFDIALISTMRDAMLRRSEAAALTWGDIEQANNGSGRLMIRRSKTDQAGGGALQYLSPETMARLEVLRPAGSSRADYVFSLRSRRPPHPDSLSTRIREAALRAGLGPGYSGHSPRVGMARDLAAAGVELPALMVAGRWLSPTMPARYARREDVGRGAVARYYRREAASPDNPLPDGPPS